MLHKEIVLLNSSQLKQQLQSYHTLKR